MILLHGVTGFVGKHLLDFLKKNKYNFCLQTRHVNKINDYNVRVFDSQTQKLSKDDKYFLKNNIKILIYVSGIAHSNSISFLNKKKLKNIYDEDIKYFQNYISLFEESNLKKIIYISSSKINEIYNKEDVTELDFPKINNLYSIYKLQYEKIILNFCKINKKHYFILRPPAIYGKGSKGNFSFLIKLIKIGIPLSLINFNGLRSYLYIENLISFISILIEKNIKKSSILFVADNENISLNDLISIISKEYSKKVFKRKYLNFLKIFIWILLPKKIYNLLFLNFILNKNKTKKYYNWSPEYSNLEGIRNTIKNDQKNQ